MLVLLLSLYLQPYQTTKARMRTIQMVDLQTQYQRIQSEVEQAFAEVIRSGAFINGPTVKTFQQNLAEYLRCRHVIACGNGTDALQIALMALDLQPGDEIITSPFTFVATAEVIKLLGLVPIFVDVEADSFNINPELIEAAITPKTRCIIPVHMFGRACNMQAIMDIAAKHQLFVVEDNAQAIGATCEVDGISRKIGSIGDIGCLSFYPSKNLGAFGDGGAINTNSDNLKRTIHRICNHGSEQRYYYESVGVNSRLDSLQAVLLDIKLVHLDGYILSRNKLADYYDMALAGAGDFILPARPKDGQHVFHQYTLRTPQRDALQQFLNAQEIPTMVYYPVPLHLQKPYMDDRHAEGMLPVSEQLCREVLSLPMHTEMETEQAAHIIKQVINFYKS
ncbi:DegT/DnrJ/EryC1/StrS family aminotransferase [soil metagenome]